MEYCPPLLGTGQWCPHMECECLKFLFDVTFNVCMQSMQCFQHNLKQRFDYNKHK